MSERQQELERRLQDVTGQLGSSKKNAKKGERILPMKKIFYLKRKIFTKKSLQILFLAIF
jgi:hypothetical protein